MADDVSVSTSRNSRRRRRWRVRLFLLALPVVGHLLLCSVTLSVPIEHGRLDNAVNVLVAGYLFIGLLLFLAPRVQAKYLLFCYSALFAAGIAEAGLSCFVSQPNGPTPWPPMRRIVTDANTMPGIEGEIQFTVSSLGIRGPDESEFDRSDLRILCVGGSTTECLYVTDKSSWPWQLQELLSQELNCKTYVGNAGRSGHFTLHHSYQIRNYDLVSRFDRIVILCGINDMVRFLRASYSRSKGRVANEALTAGPEDQVYYRRLHLAQVIRAFVWQYVDPVGFKQDASGEWYSKVRLQRQESIRESGYKQLPDGLEDSIRRYRSDLMDVLKACRERGVKPILATQPALYQAELPAELEELIWMTKLEPGNVARVMEAYNETTLSVCRAENIPCLDLASLLPKDTTVFYDDCHFNVAGCEKVAELLSVYLAGELTGEEYQSKASPSELQKDL
ncbi:MAG: SGNH/GDSL hydrolase family protein [Planctomycetota bacterium]